MAQNAQTMAIPGAQDAFKQCVINTPFSDADANACFDQWVAAKTQQQKNAEAGKGIAVKNMECMAKHPTDLIAQQQCMAKGMAEALKVPVAADVRSDLSKYTKYVLIGGGALALWMLLIIATKR